MKLEKSVLVVVEIINEALAAVSLELISKARELADTLGVAVTAVAIGKLPHQELASLGQYGCDVVYFITEPRLAHYTTVPYAKAVISVIRKYQPQIVLFGASINGRDLAPRVASALQCGLTADCTELQIGDYKEWSQTLLQLRPAFGGNIVATIVSPESMPSMASVREGVMPLKVYDSLKRAMVVIEDITWHPEDFPTEVLQVTQTPKTVNLPAAQIIVAAGMGVNNQTSLQLVQTLAKTLGAAVACTRPVVDAGFLSLEHQVGQTGVTVRPVLYIACGISGQIQHTVGIQDAKRIIAINSDPQAPIFNIAHYKIVGDLNEVLPKMITAYKRR